MKFYGTQKYKMAEAASAYANNHVDGDKTRIKSNRVEVMKKGQWQDAGDVKKCAERWDALNK